MELAAAAVEDLDGLIRTHQPAGRHPGSCRAVAARAGAVPADGPGADRALGRPSLRPGPLAVAGPRAACSSSPETASSSSPSRTHAPRPPRPAPAGGPDDLDRRRRAAWTASGSPTTSCCAALDADPLTLIAGELDHKPQLPILLALTEEAAERVRRARCGAGCARAARRGRPLDHLLARDYARVRGRARRPGRPRLRHPPPG